MKNICYSIFGAKDKTPENAFLFYAYMRGLVWNVKMNRLLYPGWITHVEIDVHTYSQYDHIFNKLQKLYGVMFNVNPPAPLCKAMLWRLKPLFEPGVDRIICRDADAITTHREACMVKDWENTDLPVHLIADNPAHSNSLMGGMCGFKTDYFLNSFGWKSFEEMLQSANEDFSFHGADQNFLAKFVAPNVHHETMAHLMSGQNPILGQKYNVEQFTKELPGVDNKLWESNLTCRHIGSAGVVDLETIRFFQRFDTEIPEMKAVELLYPEIFYWHNK